MTLPGFEELFTAVDKARPQRTVVAIGGEDATVLQALHQAQKRGWVRPCVTGNEAAILRLAEQHGIALEDFRILDRSDPVGAAIDEVRNKRADLLMKGQIPTPTLLKALLHPWSGLRTEHVICQVVLMEIVPAGKRFLLADTGITPRPTLPQKLDILASAVGVAHRLGVKHPRVAVMSATEKATEALPDSLEAEEIQKRGQPGCEIQGPLSFDLAYAPESGRKKGVKGPVAGAADIMLFPDLVSANLTVKAIMYTAECRYGGVLCGVGCPVVFMSRADSTQTRLHSLALALRLAVDREDSSR